jgi:hypothetical protein
VRPTEQQQQEPCRYALLVPLHDAVLVLADLENDVTERAY